MREVDRRTKVTRRVFLRSTATAVPAAAVLASGGVFTANAWADATALSPHVMATITRMARDTYPHDRLADVYYVTAVAPWDGKAAADPAVKALLEEGVSRLDAEALRHDRPGSGVGGRPCRGVARRGTQPVLPEDPRRSGRIAL
jgi:hypothetical protein